MEEPQPKPPSVDLQLLPRAAREKSLTFSARSSPRTTCGLCVLYAHRSYTASCLLMSDGRADLVQARSLLGALLVYLRADKLRGFHAYAEANSARHGGQAYL